jgi:ribosomal protein S12 methylthiotransferase
MLASTGRAGYVVTGNLDYADIAVINTCAFIESAVDEAVEVINDICKRKKKSDLKKVIATGCLPQRIGSKISELCPDLDAIINLANRDNIADIIADTLDCKDKEFRSHFQSAQNEFISDDSQRLLITPSHWAYLRISLGCDRKCAFCTIPSIRGPFRSKPPREIIEEAAALANSGVKEINIIAQDSNYYGTDLNRKNPQSPKTSLASILKKLEKIENLPWIRTMYLYPAGVKNDLIETIADSEKILNYFDIPIQHISDKILRDMNRADTREKTTALIENIRKAIPSAVLRTTIIVGFPGETNEDFNQLLDFVKQTRFDALGCFKYSQETGTPAAKLPNQVPEQTKQHRFDQLMAAQKKIAIEKNKKLKGSKHTCLIDETDPDSKTAIARYFGQAPCIDSVCIVKNCSAQPGSFINCRITGHQEYDLIAEPA